MMRIDEWTECLGVLGLPADARRSEIQRAYRHVARLYHPDVNRSAGAERRFREATEAYANLGELLSMKEAAEGDDLFRAVCHDPVFEKISTAHLRRRLRGSTLWQVRASAAAALGSRGGESAGKALAGALRDPDSRVRSVARRAVGALLASGEFDRLFPRGAPIGPLTASVGSALRAIQRSWLERGREPGRAYASAKAAS